MSDLLYNEVPVTGTKYNFGDWKLYARHTDTEICGFFEKYRFLSNFEPCKVWYEGKLYHNVECAYQAAKLKISEREYLTRCTPAGSKKYIRDIAYNQPEALLYSAADWDSKKYDIMLGLIFQKFLNNKDLRQKLIDTENKFLEESNHWSDSWWGVYYKLINNQPIKIGGQNNLGKILMSVRNLFLRA